MNPQTVVRLAREGDAGPLGEFFLRSWKETGPNALGFTGADDEAIKEIASEAFLTNRLRSPNTKIVVAERQRRVLGFASIKRVGQREAELSGVVVLESETGHGLGTRLVRKACGAALSMGFGTLTVKTEAFNVRAIGFYKKSGFVEMKRATEKVGKRRIPVMILRRELHQNTH